MKKKDHKPKTTIQILATIGLVIAILWTGKFLFQLGGAGFNEVKNKVSKDSGLPVLKCVPTDNSDPIIYDLAAMEANEPKDIPEDSDARKEYYEKDHYHVFVNTTDDEYQINTSNTESGIQKGYTITINRSSGVIEWTIPPHYPIGISFSEALEYMKKAKRYSGVCTKIKKKNL